MLFHNPKQRENICDDNKLYFSTRDAELCVILLKNILKNSLIYKFKNVQSYGRAERNGKKHPS